MRAASIASPDDQKVTFVELFFDLVFVFSVTQIVGLLHDGITGATVGRAVLAFWLVWWAWTQFTWALNAADTTNEWVELVTLVATAVAFFLAIAVPDAFDGSPLRFAIPYVLVRVLGLALYAWVAASDPLQRAAVRRFSVVSVGGLVAVIAGALAGGGDLYVWWAVAIVLDVIAAAVGGQSEGWNIHPEHFCERHGLFIIIALGESLIVAAGGMTGRPWTGDLTAVGILAVAVTCALWWTYFPRVKPELDSALESARGSRQSMMARDVFSLVHFPLICGIIAFAAALEEAVARPGAPFPATTRFALAAGITLFVGGMAVARWRASCGFPWPRAVISLATAAIIALWSGATPPFVLAVAFVGVSAVAVLEQRTVPGVTHESATMRA